jgi:protein-disulfide isomerase
MTSPPRRAARDLRILAGRPFAVVLAVLFSNAIAPPSQAQQSEFLRFYLAQPRVPLVVPADGAKVLIVKFNDFQCPPCSQTYLQYKSLFAKYDAEHPGAVKVVLKDYPLNRDCNDNVTQTLHPAACDAAVAVRLAELHNRTAPLEEFLYTHQPDMTGPMVRQAAREIGQVNDFEAKYSQVMTLVKGDIAFGRQLGVRSTPTFFINGVKLEGGYPAPYIDQAIAYELEHVK